MSDVSCTTDPSAPPKPLTKKQQAKLEQALGGLAEKLSALNVERYLRERAKRGEKVDIDAILAKVPLVEPEPDDRLP